MHDTPGSAGLDAAGLDAEVVERVLDGVRTALIERGSELAGEDTLDPGFEIQARSILAEVSEKIRAGDNAPPAVSVEYNDIDSLVAHGEFSAKRELDPIEPLMAAEILFAVALPAIADAVSGDAGKNSAIDLALWLHHAIWRRFPPGAVAYVHVIRSQLSAAQAQSRQRISRELHDRIAHGISAGIQRVELASMTDDPGALDSAIEILRATLADTQSLALDVRLLVGDRSLCDALEQHAASTNLHSELPVRVGQIGAPGHISSVVAEELFAIALEAIRNARSHSFDASQIVIELAWTPAAMTMTITDDGAGYDEHERRPNSLGIQGMNERAQSVGAEFALTTEPNATGVVLSLPFARSR